ncbi:MAG: GyrI-like domain-containing protein, partial [Planctomycetota bacterium]|nr:GyrI-like domain-containing protein [Planctomycetota bacterium]
MKPEFRDVQSFRVIGLGESYELNKAQGISQLWEQFMPRTATMTQRVGMEAFGIGQCKGDRFEYLAGVKVESDAPIPEGMVDMDIEAGHYAVFTHRGPISKIADSMKYIWST